MPERKPHIPDPSPVSTACAWVWKTLAILSLVAGVGAVCIQLYREPLTIESGLGGYYRTPLPDGSQLELNTDTRVLYRTSTYNRVITLHRGEIRIEVARDASRPLEVRVAGRVVKALGTIFTVRLHDNNELTVIVEEGSVLVQDGHHNDKVVRAMEMASVGQSGPRVMPLAQEELKILGSWRSGTLIFRGQALSHIVAEFNRFNERKIRIDDPALGELRLTGEFSTTNVDQFEKRVTRTLPVDTKLMLEDSREVLTIKPSAQADDR
jgi:transmembrane sensor